MISFCVHKNERRVLSPAPSALTPNDTGLLIPYQEVATTKEFDRYPKLNPRLQAKADTHLDRFIGELIDLIVMENDLAPQADLRKARAYQAFRELLSVILLNLVFITLRHPKHHIGELRCPTSGDLASKGTLGPLFSQRRTKKALEAMTKSHLVSRRPTRTWGTLLSVQGRLAEMVDLRLDETSFLNDLCTGVVDSQSPTIVVRPPKDELKDHFQLNPVPPVNDAERLALDAEMVALNEALARRSIYYDDGLSLQPINDYIRRQATNPLEFSSGGSRWLRRIFNNNTLSHGGRMFGGCWQQWSATRRQRLTLDGDRCAYLDYNAMGIRLLLAHAGQPSHSPEDLYNRVLEHDSRFTRKGLKVLLHSLLGAFTPLRNWPEGALKHFPQGTRFKDVLAALDEAYPELSDYWCKGMASVCQRTESAIMVDVVRQALGQDITILPIHDGLLCPVGQVNEVMHLMEQCFADHTGGALGVVTREW